MCVCVLVTSERHCCKLILLCPLHLLTWFLLCCTSLEKYESVQIHRIPIFMKDISISAGQNVQIKILLRLCSQRLVSKPLIKNVYFLPKYWDTVVLLKEKSIRVPKSSILIIYWMNVLIYRFRHSVYQYVNQSRHWSKIDKSWNQMQKNKKKIIN